MSGEWHIDCDVLWRLNCVTVFLYVNVRSVQVTWDLFTCFSKYYTVILLWHDRCLARDGPKLTWRFQFQTSLIALRHKPSGGTQYCDCFLNSAGREMACNNKLIFPFSLFLLLFFSYSSITVFPSYFFGSFPSFLITPNLLPVLILLNILFLIPFLHHTVPFLIAIVIRLLPMLLVLLVMLLAYFPYLNSMQPVLCHI
jgi:hypothetical protein